MIVIIAPRPLLPDRDIAAFGAVDRDRHLLRQHDKASIVEEPRLAGGIRQPEREFVPGGARLAAGSV